MSKSRRTQREINGSPHLWCGRGKHFKPLTSFWKNARVKNGYQSACKECQRRATRISAERNAGLAYDPDRTKVCTACKRELEISNFKAQKAGRFGVTSWCKDCTRLDSARRNALLRARKPATIKIPKPPRIEKSCNGCKQILPLSAYHKSKAQGVASRCKACSAKRTREYRQRNRQQVLERIRASRASNRNRHREYVRAYRKRHPDRARAKLMDWRKRNPDKVKEIRNRHYYLHRQAIRTERRLRRKENKRVDRLQQRVHANVRRTRKANAAGTFSREQFIDKCTYFGWRCYLCRKVLTAANVVVEHRLPLSRGGSNWISNLAPSCKTCNQRKHNKTEREYKDYLRKVASCAKILPSAA